jgi:diguanylate cyclase (GGDEF)-like protein
MPSLKSLLPLFRVPADNPELVRSQLGALARQVPLLYFVLVVNTAALAATHLARAPAYLTIYLPVLFCLLCIRRLLLWRRMPVDTLSHDAVVLRLKRAVGWVCLIGVAFTAWALALYPYGDAHAQSHVAFYMAITVIGCIFCLMHLRPAALALTIIVLVPYTLFFATRHVLVFDAMAANVFLVALALIVILFANYRDFANLIESQKALRAKQQETQRLSDDNDRLANLDSLTDLPNRRRFFRELDQALARATRTQRRLAVGVLDLDGFKPVNDAYGHAMGDQVLMEVGRRLRQRCGTTAFVARLGGDEFGILVESDLDPAALLEFGRNICALLQLPYVMPDVTAQLSGSIGFALYPDAGDSPAVLFERADYALYYAKQHSRGLPAIFSSRHETEIRETSLIEQTLRHADLMRELSLAFQPIVAVTGGRPIGFEALARWNSPTLGSIPPHVFIKLAERSELIRQLTDILLHKTLQQVHAWPEPLTVSFNLSTRDIATPEAIARIREIVAYSGIAPARIEFEITETAVMRDFEQAQHAMHALKDLGVKLALDDFGTGYSSLSYVRRLPLDKIKIDRSFIAEIETDATCANIVKSVIDLTRNLGLACVVEGVESEAQLEILGGLGCDVVQGFLFARPMAAGDIGDFLARCAPREPV